MWFREAKNKTNVFPIDFSKIKFDIGKIEKITELVGKHYSYNPGCKLSGHWQTSLKRDVRQLKNKPTLRALNWVGDGYPKTTRLKALEIDHYHFANLIKQWNTLDVQSGVHQFYVMDAFLKARGITLGTQEKVTILEIGGGYGRMALFFLSLLGKRCRYINIDFVPTSLACSPQVIAQLFPDLSVVDAVQLETTPEILNTAHYVALPAWHVPLLDTEQFLAGINIHSFQEMEPETFAFYKELFAKHIKPGGLLYFVNNPPDSYGVGNRYREHAYYGLESFFVEISSQINRFTADWEAICGVPSLERVLIRNSQ